MTEEDLLWFYPDNSDIKQMVARSKGQCLTCNNTGRIDIGRSTSEGTIIVGPSTMGEGASLLVEVAAITEFKNVKLDIGKRQ